MGSAYNYLTAVEINNHMEGNNILWLKVVTLKVTLSFYVCFLSYPYYI